MDQYKCFWRASLDLISNTLILNHLHRKIKSCVCTATCLFVYLSQKTITCKMIWYIYIYSLLCKTVDYTHKHTDTHKQTDTHTLQIINGDLTHFQQRTASHFSQAQNPSASARHWLDLKQFLCMLATAWLRVCVSARTVQADWLGSSGTN